MFINEKSKSIEMNAKEYDLAMTYGTEEYHALREIRNDYPGFAAEIVSVKKPVKVKDKLNMKTIKAYVKAHATDDQKAEFENIAFPHITDEGVYIEAQSFFQIRKWFYAQFPEYKKAVDDYQTMIDGIFKEVENKIDEAKKKADDKKREELKDAVAAFRAA